MSIGVIGDPENCSINTSILAKFVTAKSPFLQVANLRRRKFFLIDAYESHRAWPTLCR